MKKMFERSSNGMLGGVCEGIANYFGIDPTVVRVAWIVVSWFYGIGILLYIALALTFHSWHYLFHIKLIYL